MAERERVRIEREERLLVLTIDRAEARNALDRETVEELRQALDAAASDPEVGCLVVTGAGDKVFVSGADVKELRDRTVKQGLEARLSRFFSELERHPKVTIAAINGFCLGGGLELALACDIRVAADSARLGFPETGIGILPGAGGTQRLPRLVGLGRAKHLVLTGEVIDAASALSIGLVSAVVPLPELLAAARAVAAKVLSRAPLATRLAKAALNIAAEAPQAAGLQFEAVAQSVLYQSEDKREGTTAFLEKRKPRFTGE